MAKSKSSNGKTECPLTRDEFLKAAKPLTVTVGGRQVVASVKEFSTGSLGWFSNDKIVVEIDGVPVKVQANLNLIVVGSKEAE
jgi:hypothetical protein